MSPDENPPLIASLATALLAAILVVGCADTGSQDIVPHCCGRSMFDGYAHLLTLRG